MLSKSKRGLCVDLLIDCGFNSCGANVTTLIQQHLQAIVTVLALMNPLNCRQ